jgi:hypothetical protein
MSTAFYDRWPEFVGKQLKVVAPWGTLDGVLTGVAAPAKGTLVAATVDPPWALSAADGRQILIDPDNPAMQIYVDGERLVPPSAPPPSSEWHGRVNQLMSRYDEFLAQLREARLRHRR